MRFQCPIDKDFNFSDLEKVIKDNQGKVTIEIDFIDLDKQISVSMKSKNLGINLSKVFQEKIHSLGIKEFFLN